MSRPVFLVGTGRCGSTMLSNILREHPALLSLSEFFCFVTDLGSLVEQAFPCRPVSATTFWRILSTCYAKQNTMLEHDIAMGEVLYPYQDPHARFNVGIGVPAIEQTTLPHLTPEFDTLFDEVHDFVLTLPTAPIGVHYRALFQWLCQRFGRRLWIERSGGSLRIVKELLETFPDARFLHLVRDGRDCAISMSKHYGFRMVVIAFALSGMLSLDPFEDYDRTDVADVSDEYYPFLPEHFDAEAFRQFYKPPSFYARYWSSELRNGLEVLATLPAERVHTMRYEDFLQEPENACRELITFLDPALLDDAWLAQTRSLIGQPHSAWQELPPSELRLLEDACAAGNEALKRHTVLPLLT